MRGSRGIVGLRLQGGPGALARSSTTGVNYSLGSIAVVSGSEPTGSLLGALPRGPAQATCSGL